MTYGKLYSVVDSSAGLTSSKPVELHAYQEEVYDKCVSEDSILFLPTGAGKTIVAAMIAWDKYKKFPKKKIVFVVNRVPLVVQQARAFERVIPGIDVETVYGHKKTVKSWELFMRLASPVLVIMDSIFYGWVCDHPEAIKTDISLLIFDEVHNALGGFQKKLIALTHQLKPRPLGGQRENSQPHSAAAPSDGSEEERRLPQILGLTASPVLSFCSYTSLQELLTHTRCKIVDVRREEADLQEKVPTPMSIVVEYLSTPYEDAMELFLHKIVLLIFKDLRVAGHPTFKKLRDCCIATPAYDNKCEQLRMAAYENVGEKDYFAATVLTFLLQMSEALALMKLESLQKVYDTIMHKSVFESLTSSADAARLLLPFMEGIVEMMKELKQGALPSNGESKNHGGVSNELFCVSSRLQYLIYILECILKVVENSDDSFCGIIFCDTRVSVHRIVKQVENHSKLKDFYKPKALIGKGKVLLDGEDVGMTDAKQKKTLEEFGKGETRLLVATSVVEEGLDVSACNFVIRYDSCVTLRSFIQSRGRARNKRSVFIVMEHVLQPYKVSKLAMKAVRLQKLLVRKIEAKITNERGAPPRLPWEECPRRWLQRFEEQYMAFVLRKETEVRENHRRVDFLHELSVFVPPNEHSDTSENKGTTFSSTGRGSPPEARRKAEIDLCHQLDAAGYFSSLTTLEDQNYRAPLKFLSSGLCLCLESFVYELTRKFAPDASRVEQYDAGEWRSTTPLDILRTELRRRKLPRPEMVVVECDGERRVRLKFQYRAAAEKVEVFSVERRDDDGALQEIALQALKTLGVVCLRNVPTDIKKMVSDMGRRPGV